MSNKFWVNKKVLITGFEGFLGSHLAKTLVFLGARIFGLDIKIRRKETVLTKADYEKITVIKGSVADYKLVERVISRNKINVVFHLAAEAIVERGYKSPLNTFKSNITGTWSLLEACRFANHLQAIVIASSDKAYGAHKKLPYTEEASLIGKNPYDVSKSCADLIAYSYFHSYGLPVAITRCGNIYGPGDFNFSRIVPDAIRCALVGKTLSIRSDGKFTRDYVYVDDIVDGYITLAEKIRKLNLAGEAFNFSDENPMEVMRLVDKIFKIIRKKPDYRILNQAKYEIRDQYLVSKKARRILNWKPRKSLAEGLKNTIKWYAHRLEI